MTISTITRERLEWLSQISCRDDIEDIGGDEIRELASMALAAMESEAKEPISFDEWSRKCALQITLCYPDFREKAKYIWDSARETRQPAPVLPEERDKTVDADDHPLLWSFNEGWNACRAAMLQAERVTTPSKLPSVIDDNLVEGLRLLQCMLDDYRERNYGHAQDWVRHIDQRFSEHSEAHGDDAYCILHRLLAGEGDSNSPAIPDGSAVAALTGIPMIPDGYVMVPKEPTDEMIAAAMNCEDVLFNSDDSFCVQFGNIYEAMLAAAPQPQNAPQNIPEIIPDCWCRACRPVVLNDMRFVVCPDCGNKRCPRANDHRNACTGSNEPGQEGSAYPAAPQEVPDGK
ncbi:hypothetical protein [Klebsiella quasipneumoniae]|uniref:hypothetical protein n=1 Tax=Klebsiella quasipneumoniae TaxID=1463165 RepID=UPI001E3C27FD|nr:hypothetical protein [Klebsiella quasipneumoniae]